jgi:hypothetical protein
MSTPEFSPSTTTATESFIETPTIAGSQSLVDPRSQMAVQPHGAAHLGKTRSPFGVWVLTFVTLGIYGLVWHYKVNRELRDFHPSIQVNPGLALLALFFPIAGWCTVYNTGKRIAQAQQLAGRGNGGCSGALGVVLCFVFALQPLYYQSELNRVWRG